MLRFSVRLIRLRWIMVATLSVGDPDGRRGQEKGNMRRHFGLFQSLRQSLSRLVHVPKPNQARSCECQPHLLTYTSALSPRIRQSPQPSPEWIAASFRQGPVPRRSSGLHH
ncbi:hypothetical protein CH063_07973 [Colletotrichum higginsianum]|uniref:Secreted protein n=1 Tax=Colletotrichum higginsianum (strain IMI 349063) TaxID=759273 RepID=H1V839_COLHI|nr:hypothetical protein CH063_07973 [Colletotrichum higginsianum]